jgi:2-polyprenyl-3-methyl-5-hydroxy-6-metoxy-1,4-benzoquinol methylase
MLGPLGRLFRGYRKGQNGGAIPAAGGKTPLFSRGNGAEPVLSTRPSRGLEEFFTQIRDTTGLTILDLGGATQKNVTFITDLGHRLYSEGFLAQLESTFGLDDTVDQSNPGQIEYFLKHTLDYEQGQFDGVLIWDVLEHLNPALVAAVVERLHKIVRPKGYLLAFFHSDDKQEAVPFYGFRILTMNTLEIVAQGARHPVQLYNNRSVERLFGKFESVKFFLAKDRLREVIVKA